MTIRCVIRCNFDFYTCSDHTSLREHFIDQHYLCEEGDCKENIFTAAFRSDIDLKGKKFISLIHVMAI